jgi:hypothetical protein
MVVDLSEESLNHQPDIEADLSTLFETLADWEEQLKPLRHELLADDDTPDVGGPTP